LIQLQRNSRRLDFLQTNCGQRASRAEGSFEAARQEHLGSTGFSPCTLTAVPKEPLGRNKGSRLEAAKERTLPRIRVCRTGRSRRTWAVG